MGPSEASTSGRVSQGLKILAYEKYYFEGKSSTQSKRNSKANEMKVNIVHYQKR